MKLAAFCLTLATAFAQKTVVVRPVEVDDVLVNPEMGIQTFQWSNGDPINPGSRWSEAGLSTVLVFVLGMLDFPETSIAYYCWFWSQLELELGKYVWDVIDLTIEQARTHNQM